MKLYAISDVHLGFAQNREALAQIPEHREDWLILGGDIGETAQQLKFAIQTLRPKFKQLIWVPGNHDLWTLPDEPEELRGEQKYLLLVELCRRLGVLTPEDPYPEWMGEGGRCVIAPLFVLYDYSFRPPEVSADRAVEWAKEKGILCADEEFLFPDPYPSLASWCAARCELTERRLSEVPSGLPTVLINHFPLREDLVRLRWIPRFSIWCGTKRTEQWHRRFRARVVVNGHLHIPATDWRDGVRFEEVSLGYPRQWVGRRDGDLLREILPGPQAAKA